MAVASKLGRKLLACLTAWLLAKSRRADKKSKEPKAHLEVERKFNLSEDEAKGLPDKLSRRGFSASGRLTMTDTFLPTVKDEDMIRIRVESDDNKSQRLLTMKDWLTVAGQRERRENEGEIDLLTSCFLRLVGRLVNGKRLLAFSKTRQMFLAPERDVVVAVDQVSGLSIYSGCYLEVEVLVPLDGDVEAARVRIRGLVVELLGEEREFVRRSYLDMLREVVS
ncbi:MAG TPA: CYTH domain-containing protein [Candidatus Obscuribacterales bacterium]